MISFLGSFKFFKAAFFLNNSERKTVIVITSFNEKKIDCWLLIF